MSTHLLSLLSDIESALIATDAAPDGGCWDTMRVINFPQGLAALKLAVRSPEKVTTARGTILLQAFTLADGSNCVKANLSWRGTENSTVYAIYTKHGINWRLEASQIADKWLDGQLPLTDTQAVLTVEDDPMEMTGTG
ncbi:MAG: hypothetical protein WCR49_13665 [Opitutae bacterium]